MSKRTQPPTPTLRFLEREVHKLVSTGFSRLEMEGQAWLERWRNMTPLLRERVANVVMDEFLADPGDTRPEEEQELSDALEAHRVSEAVARSQRQKFDELVERLSRLSGAGASLAAEFRSVADPSNGLREFLDSPESQTGKPKKRQSRRPKRG